ncbi:MAG: methyltransferase domain-containing protein [Nitrospinota bacterium]|nr:methyltransferase domain-containing protein [Nitrospinota bacterium]
MRLLVSDQRRRIMPPAKTLRAIGLRRRMTMLDAGCGPGFFCMPACRIVGKDGSVLVCDISPLMLQELREQKKRLGLKNLHIRKSSNPKIPLSDGCADFAMPGFVLHETATPEALMGEAHRALRPGGRVIVVEWHPRPTEYGPPIWCRLNVRETKKIVRRSGLLVDRDWNFDDDTCFVMAHRKSAVGQSGVSFQATETITRRKT